VIACLNIFIYIENALNKKRTEWTQHAREKVINYMNKSKYWRRSGRNCSCNSLAIYRSFCSGCGWDIGVCHE
jgi:hypothetical protein